MTDGEKSDIKEITGAQSILYARSHYSERLQLVILSLTCTHHETDGYGEGSCGLDDQQKGSSGLLIEGFFGFASE
jgi:hypothetical protein